MKSCGEWLKSFSSANLAKKPIYVRTPDGKTWEVGEGKMRVARSKPSN